MAQALLKDKASPFITADNDNHGGDLPDDIVLRAARFLVARHSPQSPIDLKAFDVPHKALADIAAQLEDMGLSYAMSDRMLEPLRGYVVQNGGEFANTTRAKPIAVHVCIRNSLPPRRFENGMTELVFVGRKQARVEGASSINVRLTANGTAMTSNAANVDAMFANVGETGLWIRFEAPTKQELDGLLSAMESGLAGVAQAVGGTMDAADLKRILETLQKAGTLTPQVETLIASLIELQKTLASKGTPPPDKIAEIVAKISETLSNPDHIDLIPPSFAEAVLATLQSVAAHPAVAPALAANGFTHLVEAESLRVQESMLEATAETLREILAADDLDPQAVEKITEVLAEIESALDAEGAATPEMMQSIAEKIAEVADMPDLPADVLIVLAELSERMTEPAQDMPQASVTPSQEMAESLYDMIEEIAQKIEVGEIDPETLPESIKAMLDSIADLKAMEAEIGRDAVIAEIAKVMEGAGDPALAMQIETIVLSLAKPEVQSLLPPAMAESVQTFIRENPAIIETVATHAVIRVLQEQVQDLPKDSPDAQAAKDMIDAIKADGLAAVVLDPKAQSMLPAPVQAMLKENPAIIEAVATQEIMRALESRMDSLPASSPEAQNMQKMMDAIKTDGLKDTVRTIGVMAMLPAPMQSFLNSSPLFAPPINASSSFVAPASPVLGPTPATTIAPVTAAPAVSSPSVMPAPRTPSTPTATVVPLPVQPVRPTTAAPTPAPTQIKPAETVKTAPTQQTPKPVVTPVRVIDAVVKPVTFVRQATATVVSTLGDKVTVPVQRIASSLTNFVTSVVPIDGGPKGFVASVTQKVSGLLSGGKGADKTTPPPPKEPPKVQPEKGPEKHPDPPPPNPPPTKPEPVKPPEQDNRKPEKDPPTVCPHGGGGPCPCGQAFKDAAQGDGANPAQPTPEKPVITFNKDNTVTVTSISEKGEEIVVTHTAEEWKRSIDESNRVAKEAQELPDKRNIKGQKDALDKAAKNDPPIVTNGPAKLVTGARINDTNKVDDNKINGKKWLKVMKPEGP